ncbi:hypothetical protein J3B02_000201 [Coemansia erecta]|uniref:Magnesium transporter n=1 Tax=Coemansia asiatica TaxID=1052880 RepID=A0A9W7XL34_9FUNG|nr:hypothetical protein LPJ64_002723 [Coemansia asiatica]KAJ2858451.1 hypothetical protein J3B02_000201 [Coemansia erecta]KAJ2878888.1 hypothetical protein FB639_003245 [Coemansia asiatica]
MSSYLFGLSAAILGNVVIGTGQCLQKYGLNRLQREWDNKRAMYLEGGASSGILSGTPVHAGGYAYASTSASMFGAGSSSVDIRSRSGSVTAQPMLGRAGRAGQPLTGISESGPRARYTSKAWVAGLALNYLGEMFGNSLALSYLSASVVAPLGIISVIVNMFLAERFLNERITQNQRFGFMVIMAGVGLILLVAPRRSAAEDAVQFVEAVSQSGVLGFFGLVYVIQAALISLIRAGHRSLFLYVLVASLFGSMNVMASKMLTMFVRLKMAFAGIPNPADIAFYGAIGAEMARPAVWFLTVPQIIAALGMGLSIVGQESFRQQALGRYPVMQFQPVFFATFNVVATLASLLLFRELDGWAHAVLFFAVFFTGIAVIVYGSRFLQKARSVVLPSHIRLHKENLEHKML